MKSTLFFAYLPTCFSCVDEIHIHQSYCDNSLWNKHIILCGKMLVLHSCCCDNSYVTEQISTALLCKASRWHLFLNISCIGLFLKIESHTYSFIYCASCLWYLPCAVCKWEDQGQQQDAIDRTIIQFKNMQLEIAAIIYCKVLWLLVKYSCQWCVSYTVSNNKQID